jgi:hypothetical protein
MSNSPLRTWSSSSAKFPPQTTIIKEGKPNVAPMKSIIGEPLDTLKVTFSYLSNVDLMILFHTSKAIRKAINENKSIPRGLTCRLDARKYIAEPISNQCEWYAAMMAAAHKGNSKLFVWLCEKDGHCIEHPFDSDTDAKNAVVCASKEAYAPLLKNFIEKYFDIMNWIYRELIPIVCTNLIENDQQQLAEWVKKTGEFNLKMSS